MKKIYCSIVMGAGSLLSLPAAIMIIAYEKGKATADKIKAHVIKLKTKNK